MPKLLTMLAVASCLGCAHTGEIEPAQQPARPPEAPKPARSSAKKPPSSPEARTPVEEGRPELSVSPEGLMHPGGPRLVQQALAKHGYLPAAYQTGKLDERTSAALRKFQGDQALAKTGAPDRETVRRLGLSLDEVFRSSTQQEPSAAL